MKLPKFKKKEVDPIEKQLKKYPRKRRAKMRELYELYNKGKVLVVDKAVDNKELMRVA